MLAAGPLPAGPLAAGAMLAAGALAAGAVPATGFALSALSDVIHPRSQAAKADCRQSTINPRHARIKPAVRRVRRADPDAGLLQ